MKAFPLTSVTLIQKIKTLSPGADDAAWVRFWDTYSGAIRTFAARKGGEANADDIMMTVLGKPVDVLRSGQYTPEKGAFHSYLSTMILNEVHMQHRKDSVRKVNRRVSLDDTLSEDGGDGDDARTLADVISSDSLAPEIRIEAEHAGLDADWRQAILDSAVEHVLTKTAISARDRAVYREYAQEGQDIDVVAARHGVSHNSVSQVKTRINRRIVAMGKELAARFGEM